MGLTVVTYGGGEILKTIFDAVAMCMNGKQGGFIQPIMTTTLSIGGIWAISKAFFSSSVQPLLAQFLFPVLAIVGIFMIPTASVHIEDILNKNKFYKIDNVPLLEAKFSEITSTIGHYATIAIEKVMHVPKDVSYNSTGMIFGADTAMDISRYKISNADLEKNLRTFCRQCVLYDLHLGRYSIDELKKTTDLWKFFEEKTSKVNMMRYTPIGMSDEKTLGQYLSCKDAIEKMTPFFKSEKQYYGQLDVCKNLGLTFQALTGLQQNAEDLIGQQLMMNLLSDEYSGNNFAKARAYVQQRNTYQVLGALASSSLVTLRAVIEALVYAAFIFVIPLSVLPGGLKCITTWAGLVVWIQLWPPFYAILNYIMQSVAHGYASTIFNGLAGAQQGLSLFTSYGLHNLQQDIYALSGYLAASIPFITYAILKGGVNSFVHLASSIMSPSHAASSSAAAEQTTGNYSFANASFGQTSYKNTSGFQTNLAPSLSGGYFQENTGSSSAIYSQDEQILKQSNSELRTSLFSDSAISQSMQTSKMHAESTVDSTQKTYSENVSQHARNMADLSSHLANSENYSSGMSQREAYDFQESGRYFQNVAENLGQQYGLSSRVSMELLLGMGIDKGIIAKGSTGLGSNKEEVLNSALNHVKSEEFQKHFQKLQDISKSDSYNLADESGKRLVESASQSYEKMQSSGHAFQIAQSELNQISQNATWAEQNAHSIRHSLNQDFVNWASEVYANEGGFAKVQEVLNKGDSIEQGRLISTFISYVKSQTPNIHAPSQYVDPQQAFDRSLPNEVMEAQGRSAINTFTKNAQMNSVLSEKREAIADSYAREKANHNEKFNQISTHIKSDRDESMGHFESESERSLYTRPFDLAASEVKSHIKKLTPILSKMNIPMNESLKPIASGFQITEEPFWMRQDEQR